MTENTVNIIQSQTLREETLYSQLRFHTHNALAKVHFPGKPIVPGALVVQIVTDCVSKFWQRPVTPVSIQRLKFIELITEQALEQEFTLICSPWKPAEEGFSLRIQLEAGGKTYVKLEARFVPLEN